MIVPVPKAVTILDLKHSIDGGHVRYLGREDDPDSDNARGRYE